MIKEVSSVKGEATSITRQRDFSRKKGKSVVMAFMVFNGERWPNQHANVVNAEIAGGTESSESEDESFHSMGRSWNRESRSDIGRIEVRVRGWMR
ncbi:hypothetical protein HA466_0136710 [Hirschfeldia incana]|nr:hypothetical protein HA466_0136710 [Hirschfeldia incana]